MKFIKFNQEKQRNENTTQMYEFVAIQLIAVIFTLLFQRPVVAEAFFAKWS